MKKFSLLLNVVLLGVIAYGGYKFLIEGSVKSTDDGRTAIMLTAGERRACRPYRQAAARFQKSWHGHPQPV